MHICLLCEGSYPYVVGGVSSWTHTLIQSMPEHKFTIVTLYPNKKDKGVFKYELPSNVVGVEEHFLDILGTEKGKYKTKFEIDEGDMEQIVVMLQGGEVNWDELFDFFEKNKGKSAQDFLMSRVFYDSIIGTYTESYSHVALSDFFWTIRSMILPLVGILGIDIPKADIYHSVSAGYAGIMAVLGRRKYGTNMLLTEHGIYTREREEEIIGASWVPVHFKDLWIKYFQNLSKCAYENTDKAITLFEDAKDIQHELGCATVKQMVIENGVDVEDFLDLPRKEVGKNGLNIGAVVRVVPIKDILTMLQAFNLVSERYPEAMFYIMGPNDESAEYFEECLSVTRLMGLEDVVTFTGRVDIDDKLGEAGIVVPIMDYKELAKAIIRVTSNKKMHDDMSQVGVKRVKKLYTKKRFIDNYKKLYASFSKSGVGENGWNRI